MHYIEPFYKWRDYYISSDDKASPFYLRQYSEFTFTDKIYNFLIHPQWDSIGSPTLYVKILFVDYDTCFVVIEMIGEWNDAIENDVMLLKREVVEPLLDKGIDKFILIGENVLNFHYSDDCYYEEWFDEVDDGWIALVNFHDHVLKEFQRIRVDNYLVMGGELDEEDWRTMSPMEFYSKVSMYVNKRLNP